MSKVQYRLKGHESFIPREGWITKGLAAVRHDPTVFSGVYAADALGVGTNMAKSIRFWLRTAGLTQEQQRTGVTLTELGEIISDNDPYLEKKSTLWILHANIARNFSQATSWNIFFNDFDLSSWQRDEMVAVMTEYIIRRTGDENPTARSVKDDCAAILQMYTPTDDSADDPEDKKRSPFASLGLITTEGKEYVRGHSSASQVGSYPVLYAIAELLSEQGYLGIDEIISGKDMPGRLFGLNRIHVNTLLDELEARGYITINRTAGLDMVYPKKTVTPNEAVRLCYENSTNEEGFIL